MIQVRRLFEINNLVFLIGAYALVNLFFFERDFLLFRDYSILWEGAYRISLGQIPFTDFGTPVGPISFLIPALFFKLFTPSWYVMQLSQMFENALLLLLSYQLLRRLQLTKANINIAIACFAIFYLVFLSHPWYNSGAFLFFLASMVFLLGLGYWSYIAAGLLAGLCFLAKQDYGVMNLCLGLLVLFLTQPDSRTPYRRLSFNWKALLDRKYWGITVSSIAVFAIAFTLPLVAVISLVDSEQFLYWFNYGQEPHQIRKIYIWNFIGRANLLIPACIAFYFAYRTRRMELLFAGIFFICSFVVSSTSGLDYTAFFFFLFLPVLIKATHDRAIVSKPWVSILLIFATLTCLILPAKYFYRMVQTTVLNKAEPYSFRYKYVTRPVRAFPDSMPYFKNVMGSLDSITLIEQLQAIFKNRDGPPLTMLNISELTPLYAELGITPPLQYPLWYHTKISLFPREIKIIDRDIDNAKFDVVILQNTHGQVNFEHFLQRLQQNPQYESLREKGFVSPTTSTGDDCFEGYCPNHIYVYVRKSLLN